MSSSLTTSFQMRLRRMPAALPPSQTWYLPGALPTKRDLRHVGPDAAVRAAGHADDDFLARQADFRAERLDAVNQAGQHTFGFRQRQAAGGQRRAGHRSGMQHAGLVFRLHAVCGQQRVDGGFVGFGRRSPESRFGSRTTGTRCSGMLPQPGATRFSIRGRRRP